MNPSRRALFCTVLVPALALASACTRIDTRAAQVHVPAMRTELDVRIVTNAALNEVAGHYAGRHACELDVNHGLAIYHEGPRVLDPAFQQRIVASLARVGYPARVLAAGHHPPAPIPLKQGPVQDWPDRCTVVLSVPGLKTNRDAAIVEDALGYARTGDDPARVAADRDGHALHLAFNAREIAVKNIEHAIAATGYAANDTPADSGWCGPFCVGWMGIESYFR